MNTVTPAPASALAPASTVAEGVLGGAACGSGDAGVCGACAGGGVSDCASAVPTVHTITAISDTRIHIRFIFRSFLWRPVGRRLTPHLVLREQESNPEKRGRLRPILRLDRAGLLLRWATTDDREPPQHTALGRRSALREADDVLPYAHLAQHLHAWGRTPGHGRRALRARPLTLVRGVRRAQATDQRRRDRDVQLRHDAVRERSHVVLDVEVENPQCAAASHLE